MSGLKTEDVDWKSKHCQNHPERPAAVWINPPIGGLFCAECYKELRQLALWNKYNDYSLKARDGQ